MEDLKLYYLPTCPYCLKVLRYIDDKDFNIELVSTTETANRDYLIENGGKNQVPCLFIDGKPLYESSDIISYLAAKID